MRIGIPKSLLTQESYVAITPETVKQFLKLGFKVEIEKGIGKIVNINDDDYVQSGAIIKENNEIWKSDIILKVNAPEDNEIELINCGKILISFIWPEKNPELMKKLALRKITVIAMDSVPRISRAQSLDALSSMANIAGYRAVIEAANAFGRFFSGQITVAGKIPPAKVMIIGAGVAGLAAIGVANSLGAIVYAFDSRSEVKEQVQSMGAKFIELNIQDFSKNKKNFSYNINDESRYKAFINAETELFNKKLKEMDIIITTAIMPNKSAPKLITKEMVNSMKPGSVIVDLASKNGGNCEYTVADKIITTANNVKIIGYTDLPGRLPLQASQLYSTNLLNLIKLMCKSNNGIININLNDSVIRGMTVIYNGEIIWPAPLTQFSTQSNQSKIKNQLQIQTTKKQLFKLNSKTKLFKFLIFKYILLVLSIIFSIWLINFIPVEFITHLTVFLLSCVVGYYLVWSISHTLHTPLILVTNAISGIIIIGALMQIGNFKLVNILSFITTVITSINIFGGFAVTRRMLKMFYKKNKG